MTMHEEIADRLSDYLDDELTADERQLVDQHLAECADCERTLADLQRIVEQAGSLPVRAPSSDLWDGIAQRISTTPRAVPAGRRRFSFTMPQLAAASVLLALLSGWIAVRVLGPSGGGAPAQQTASTAPSDAPAATGTVVPIAFEDEQYDAAVSDLQGALTRGRDRLDPETVKTVENDLRIIDEAVEDARRALAADPSNGYLTGYLVQTRQRKLELLRRAAALTQVESM